MFLAADKVDVLLEALAAEAGVFVAQTAGGVAKFAPLGAGGTVDIGMTKTMLPPKDLLFAQSQRLYKYGTDAEGNMFVDAIVESGEQVLFGARPCDVRSIECLDDVFLTRSFTDEHYAARRDKLLIVALACTAPAQSCFCESVGISPSAAPAADILMRGCGGEGYIVTAQTEKGETAVAGTWAAYLTDDAGHAAPVDVHCTLAVDTTDMKDTFAALFESEELWAGYSAKCLGCGACTFGCPSCYCFDIDQENRCKEGVRFRCWDSCMFSEYTQMAGGHNPRPTKMERFRNRFMHKLSWFEDRYGKTLCVGCGRCIDVCPVGVDISSLIERAGEVYAAQGGAAAGASGDGAAGDAEGDAVRAGEGASHG